MCMSICIHFFIHFCFIVTLPNANKIGSHYCNERRIAFYMTDDAVHFFVKLKTAIATAAGAVYDVIMMAIGCYTHIHALKTVISSRVLLIIFTGPSLRTANVI